MAIELVRDALVPMPDDIAHRVAASSDQHEIERILHEWMTEAFAEVDRQIEEMFSDREEADRHPYCA